MDTSKIIYLVTSGSYSDYGINGVFSTKDKAEAYAKTIEGDVEEFYLDAIPELKEVTVHSCRLDRATGNLVDERTITVMVGKSNNRVANYPMDDHEARWLVEGGGHYAGSVTGHSLVSPDHARKLAAEHRQWLLRQKS